MTTARPSVLRSALALVNLRRIGLQIVLGLIVFALSVLWLLIADAGILDLIGSALLGVAVLAIAGTGQASIVLQLCKRPIKFKTLSRGAVWVLLAVALWFGWSLLLTHIHGDDNLRAGYLNSRFSHSARTVFTFEHILLCLSWLWTILQCLGAGVIAAVAFAAIASTHPLRAAIRSLSSITYWLCLLPGVILSTILTSSLLSWTPGHGLTIESLSLVLRLAAAILVDAFVVMLLLAILAICVLRDDANYETAAGTDEDSHPRTVEKP